MAGIDDIEIPSLLFQEGSAPSTPASTKWRLYFKSDGLYAIDDAGTEVGPFATSAPSASDVSVTTVYRATDQNVGGSGTATVISWSDESRDDDGLWAIGSPTKFVIPAGLDGRTAVLAGQVRWSGSTSGAYRLVGIRRVGSTLLGVQLLADLSIASGVYVQAHTPPITLAENDEFELYIQADATGIGLVGGDMEDSWFSLYTID